jgi:hypothetical protein
MLVPAALMLMALAAPAEAPNADDDLVSVGPGDLPKYWDRRSTNLTEGIGPKDIARDAAGCAAVQFIVEKDGSTSSFKLLRDMPPDRFGAVAKKVVANLKFEPTERNPKRQAVFTYMTITFQGADNQATGSHSSSLVTLDDRMNTLCAVKGIQ